MYTFQQKNDLFAFLASLEIYSDTMMFSQNHKSNKSDDRVKLTCRSPRLIDAQAQLTPAQNKELEAWLSLSGLAAGDVQQMQFNVYQIDDFIIVHPEVTGAQSGRRPDDKAYAENPVLQSNVPRGTFLIFHGDAIVKYVHGTHKFTGEEDPSDEKDVQKSSEQVLEEAIKRESGSGNGSESGSSATSDEPMVRISNKSNGKFMAMTIMSVQDTLYLVYTSKNTPQIVPLATLNLACEKDIVHPIPRTGLVHDMFDALVRFWSDCTSEQKELIIQECLNDMVIQMEYQDGKHLVTISAARPAISKKDGDGKGGDGKEEGKGEDPSQPFVEAVVFMRVNSSGDFSQSSTENYETRVDLLIPKKYQNRTMVMPMSAFIALDHFDLTTRNLFTDDPLIRTEGFVIDFIRNDEHKQVYHRFKCKNKAYVLFRMFREWLKGKRYRPLSKVLAERCKWLLPDDMLKEQLCVDLWLSVATPLVDAMAESHRYANVAKMLDFGETGLGMGVVSEELEKRIGVHLIECILDPDDAQQRIQRASEMLGIVTLKQIVPCVVKVARTTEDAVKQALKTEGYDAPYCIVSSTIPKGVADSDVFFLRDPMIDEKELVAAHIATMGTREKRAKFESRSFEEQISVFYREKNRGHNISYLTILELLEELSRR